MRAGWRTALALVICGIYFAGTLLAWAQKIPEGPSEMVPILVIAVGYLLGADALAQGRKALHRLTEEEPRDGSSGQ